MLWSVLRFLAGTIAASFLAACPVLVLATGMDMRSPHVFEFVLWPPYLLLDLTRIWFPIAAFLAVAFVLSAGPVYWGLAKVGRLNVLSLAAAVAAL